MMLSSNSLHIFCDAWWADQVMLQVSHTSSVMVIFSIHSYSAFKCGLSKAGMNDGKLGA